MILGLYAAREEINTLKKALEEEKGKRALSEFAHLHSVLVYLLYCKKMVPKNTKNRLSH